MRDYFEMWYEDKMSILETMYRNMNADIECGYNPRGNLILKQLEKIAEYTEEFNSQMEMLKDLSLTYTERKIENWCKLDLLERGAIEL